MDFKDSSVTLRCRQLIQRSDNLRKANDIRHYYTQCMILYSDFHSPVEGAGDLGFDPDYEYKDWNWCLARTDGGKWHLLDWGY